MKLAGSIVLLLLLFVILSVSGCDVLEEEGLIWEPPAMTPTNRTIVNCQDFGNDCKCHEASSWYSYNYKKCDSFVVGEMVCGWHWDWDERVYSEEWCFTSEMIDGYFFTTTITTTITSTTPTDRTIVNCDDFGNDCYCYNMYAASFYETCDGFVEGELVCDWFWSESENRYIEFWCLKMYDITTTSTTTTTIITLDGEPPIDGEPTITWSIPIYTYVPGPCTRGTISGHILVEHMPLIQPGWDEWDVPGWLSFPTGEGCNYTSAYASYTKIDSPYIVLYVDITDYNYATEAFEWPYDFDFIYDIDGVGYGKIIDVNGYQAYETADYGNNEISVIVDIGNGIWVWLYLMQSTDTAYIYQYMNAIDYDNLRELAPPS